jgi:hypothetical protein
MINQLSIIIVDDSEDIHWSETARNIKDALETVSASLDHCPDIILVDVEELQSLARFGNTRFCVICHPIDITVLSLLSLDLDILWLFVSGGDRPRVQRLPIDLSSSKVVWFSGVYGRENQFKSWLTYWAEHGFAPDAFASTHDALFSGKTGLGITATRLRRNLLPLIMVLESYQGLVGSSPATENQSTHSVSADRAHNWLTESLSQLWEQEEIFKSLSKDAALIYGAIKNWTPDSRSLYSRLTELLQDFLPRDGFHALYDPALDESLRNLIFNRIELARIDTVVNDWCQKLSELSTLLGVVPAQDPSSK